MKKFQVLFYLNQGDENKQDSGGNVDFYCEFHKKYRR